MILRIIVRCAVVAGMLLACSSHAEEKPPLPVAKPNAGERIDWQVIAAGGAVNIVSASYRLSGTVGQTAVGSNMSANYGCNSGFWQDFGSGGNTSCCTGRVGDANGSGDDLPTIGDISVMIDAKFITGVCISEGAGANIRCLGEADANLSGGANPTCDDISIGDISMLIDCLFITGEPPFVRNNCAQ
jgi:hypothetical protein